MQPWGCARARESEMLARRIDLSGRGGDLPASVVVLELALATKQRAGSDAWEARREATQSVVMRRPGAETVQRRVRSCSVSDLSAQKKKPMRGSVRYRDSYMKATK